MNVLCSQPPFPIRPNCHFICMESYVYWCSLSICLSRFVLLSCSSIITYQDLFGPLFLVFSLLLTFPLYLFSSNCGRLNLFFPHTITLKHYYGYFSFYPKFFLYIFSWKWPIVPVFFLFMKYNLIPPICLLINSMLFIDGNYVFFCKLIALYCHCLVFLFLDCIRLLISLSLLHGSLFTTMSHLRLSSPPYWSFLFYLSIKSPCQREIILLFALVVLFWLN